SRESGSATQRVRDRGHRHGQAPRRRYHQSQYPDRRSGAGSGRAAHPERVETTAVSTLGHGAGQRRNALEISLHRPAPRRHAVQHRAAAQGGASHPRQPRFAGLLRDRNPVHDALDAGRSARLSSPQPRTAGIVLCPAAIATTVQTDPDDFRLRQIFPDRALLPRRRSARRPPARIHPDRSRDVLSAARAHLGSGRRLLDCGVQTAGYEIKTPFPRMDFDDAIRQYGVDKPDLRLPAFTEVGDCFAAADLETLAINPELPVIAIRTPKVGELSRKERDDIKPLFVSKGGARVFEDFKRIENKHPEAAAKIRAKAGVAADDLLVLVVGSKQSGAKGDAHPASKRNTRVTPAELAIYASAGLLRVALAQKYSDRHQLFQKGDFR